MLTQKFYYLNKKYYVLISVFLFISMAGCVNNTQQASSIVDINTKEFNLKGEINILPKQPLKGGKISITYNLVNEGAKDVSIMISDDLNDMISLTCERKKIKSYTIPKDISDLPLYVLTPGSSMAFVWEIQLDENVNDNICKGSISFDYEDETTIIKYISFVNEDELVNANYNPSETKVEVVNNGNILVKVYTSPSDPIIVSPSNQNDPVLLFVEISNVGDGKVYLDNIRIKSDESLEIDDGCVKDKLRRDYLKPGEKTTISCDVFVKDIPRIEEKYRVEVVIPYRVSFMKLFQFNFYSQPVTGKAVFRAIDFTMRCNRLRIDSFLRLSIGINDVFVQKMCPLITSGLARYYLSALTNYAKDEYGYKDGYYWGYEIYGRSYSRAFAQASYDDKLKSLLPSCFIDYANMIKDKGCVADINEKDKMFGDCVNELYNMIDESKVKERLIEPRKDKVFSRMKRYAQRGINEYKTDIRRVINRIYENEFGEEMRQLRRVDLFGINIKTNVDGALKYAILNNINDLLLPTIDENKESVLQNYETGFMQGFREGFTKRLKESILADLERYCG